MLKWYVFPLLQAVNQRQSMVIMELVTHVLWHAELAGLMNMYQVQVAPTVDQDIVKQLEEMGFSSNK